MHIKRFFLNPVMVLIILCLGIGIYKIAMTACVANDSVTFMQFAEDLKTTPAQSIRSYDQHPGYSVLILVSEWLCKAMGFMGTLQERIYAAQAVTLISRTITLCFVFKIFCFYGRIKTALWGTILFVLVPAYADVGSNVLSDWPGLMWMTIALYCCLLGLRHQNLLYFLTAGAASGLGYWIRPEGAALVAVTGIYTLIYLFQEKRNKIKMCICFGIMVIAAGLITSPYMIYKGSLFPKKDIGNFRVSCESIGTPSPDTAACFQKADILAALPLKPAKAVWRFIERISNVLYLLTVPLLGIMIYKTKRYRRLPDHEQLVCLFNGLWLLLLIWLYCNHGYISQRHILPMTAFNFAWIFKGLHGTVLVLGSKRCHLHRNTAILIAVCVAVFIPKLVRPVHADKATYRQAGLWLKENTPADATLAVFDTRVGFYAERPFTSSHIKSSSKQDYLVVRTSDIPNVLPPTALTVLTGLRDIDNVISIYELHP